MGNRYSLELKNEVLKLGATGLTYGEIRKQFPIPKSTLSVWFNHEKSGRVIDRTRQLEHLKRARVKSAKTKNQQKTDRLADAVARAKTEVAHISLSDLYVCKAMLAMLYWAEGTKSDKAMLVFVNTDPLLAKFYLLLLRATYPIDESRLKIRIHLHSYHSPKKALLFWSRHLKVPESQFGKIYVKKRSEHKKFRENFQGICFIYYGEMRIRRELLSLGTLIAENFSSRICPWQRYGNSFGAKKNVHGHSS